jgi:hypothetical protein
MAHTSEDISEYSDPFAAQGAEQSDGGGESDGLLPKKPGVMDRMKVGLGNVFDKGKKGVDTVKKVNEMAETTSSVSTPGKILAGAEKVTGAAAKLGKVLPPVALVAEPAHKAVKVAQAVNKGVHAVKNHKDGGTKPLIGATQTSEYFERNQQHEDDVAATASSDDYEG